eukprot:190732-Chlamydomonas_euryale.AAC.12
MARACSLRADGPACHVQLLDSTLQRQDGLVNRDDGTWVVDAQLHVGRFQNLEWCCPGCMNVLVWQQ